MLMILASFGMIAFSSGGTHAAGRAPIDLCHQRLRVLAELLLDPPDQEHPAIEAEHALTGEVSALGLCFVHDL